MTTNQKPADDKEIQLLRIFKVIDALSKGHKDFELLADTPVIDGKKVFELDTQFKELSSQGAFNYSGSLTEKTQSSIKTYYKIQMNGQSIDQWRKRASEVLGNT